LQALDKGHPLHFKFKCVINMTCCRSLTTKFREEENMKNLVSIAATASFLAFAFAIVANAQDTTTPAPQQTVNGGSNVAVSGLSGDQVTGGFAGGNGNGTFDATDPLLAQGDAATAGAGVSSQKVGTNSASSKANAVISTLADANGATAAGISLSGAAQQGDYAGTGATGSTTFANGGNTTTGIGSGSENGTGSLSGSGIGDAKGKTFVSAIGAGTNDASSVVRTTGSSRGTVTFQPADLTAAPVESSNVSGTGLANGQSVAGNPTGSSYAVGAVQANAAYAATDPSSATAAGFLNICGSTGGKVSSGGNSAAAASQIHAIATAH
jgi:hypothetical protein